jgi:hypothetical protein
MNHMSAPAESTATPSNKELTSKAADSAMDLRDAIYALRVIVDGTWDSNADMARNAIDWISKKMDEECDALHDSLDALEAAYRKEGVQ